jgi:hypothetical protein
MSLVSLCIRNPRLSPGRGTIAVAEASTRPRKRGFPQNGRCVRIQRYAVFAPGLIIVELRAGQAGTLVIGPS